MNDGQRVSLMFQGEQNVIAIAAPRDGLDLDAEKRVPGREFPMKFRLEKPGGLGDLADEFPGFEPFDIFHKPLAQVFGAFKFSGTYLLFQSGAKENSRLAKDVPPALKAKRALQN